MENMAINYQPLFSNRIRIPAAALLLFYASALLIDWMLLHKSNDAIARETRDRTNEIIIITMAMPGV